MEHTIGETTTTVELPATPVEPAAAPVNLSIGWSVLLLLAIGVGVYMWMKR